MVTKGVPIEDLIGSLNEVELRYDPKRLFIAGDDELLRSHPRVSVIGSRSASPEGLEAARMISREIVKRGGVVVSGLARGIDTAAHQAAIDAGGRTIAVLGNGLDVSYPRENTALQKLIGRKHLVVTQFPEGTPPSRGNFPKRNETMALLSDGSIIVEAGASSGTTHQGWAALRLCRPLFFPDHLLEMDFSWPRNMESYGAISFPLRDINHCLDHFFPELSAVIDGQPDAGTLLPA